MDTEDTHLILGCGEVLREKRGYVRLCEDRASGCARKVVVRIQIRRTLRFCLPSKKIP